MLSKWPCISRCGDYWQQAELRTDGARRIMVMMMMGVVVVCMPVLTVGSQVDECIQPGGTGEQTSSPDRESDPEADCT